MNYIDPPHNHLPQTDWQILGELQLQVGSYSNGTINQWLTQTIGPFSLPEDFVSKLLKSIEDAAARVLSPGIEQGQFEYLKIVVLAPAGLALKRQTWGFFRVERNSPDIQTANSKGHWIKYYIYLDR